MGRQLNPSATDHPRHFRTKEVNYTCAMLGSGWLRNLANYCGNGAIFAFDC